MENLNILQQTSDGGYILGGFSGSGISGDKSQGNKGATDYWVVKLRADGTKDWDKSFGGNGEDILYSLQQTRDGGYILGGYSGSDISGDKSQTSKGGNDFWVVKLRADGTKDWDKSIGGSGFDILSSLQQTPDGGYILGGYSASGISGDKTEANKGGTDYWVVKLQADGSIAWDKTIGGNSSDILKSLQLTTDGGYILGGYTDSGNNGDKSQASKGGIDYWVVKLQADGTKAWDKTIGGNNTDYISCLQQTRDGGYILGGYSSSGISGDKTQANYSVFSNFWVVKLQADGTKAWDKTIGGNSRDELTSLQQTSDGGYLLGGASASASSNDKSEANKGGTDYWLVKLQGDGTMGWDKTFGGNVNDRLTSLQQTRDGGYVLGGFSDSGINGDKTQANNGGMDFWVVKLGAANTPPKVAPQNLFTTNGVPLGIHLSGIDADYEALTFLVAQGPSFGTLSGTAPDLIYTAKPGYFGPDAFTYTANDGQSPSLPATVSITVHQPATYRINAGGPLTTNSKGTFAADNYFAPAPGQTTSTGITVSGPLDGKIYQSERSADTDNGSFSYNFPVDNGQYTVILHFNEFYWTWSDQRVFDVKAEGGLVLDNYDIYKKAGGTNRATTETLVVNVTDGTLDLHFSALASEGGINRPKVSAIEVIPFGIFNKFPVANAGADKTITLPVNTLVLSGSGTDTDGKIGSYAWQQVSGPATATFSSPTLAAPTVSDLVRGTYVFSLLVTDDKQAQSAADQVTVTVRANQLPVANAGADKTITLPQNSVGIIGSGSDADGTIGSYAWQQVSGPNTATFTSPTVAAPNVINLVAGTYVFSLVVTDNELAVSAADQVTLTVNPVPAQRINAGGPQLVTPTGTFTADTFFSPAPGFTFSTTNPIAGTQQEALYQSERSSEADNGSFGYALPKPNGQYTVVLHFAELYWNAPGQRVFDVAMEGVTVLNNYDIVKKTGANFTATTESVIVNLADGILNINFSAGVSEGGVNRPKVSALEVIPYSGANKLPVANAGADKTITLPVSSVTLQGAGSDPEGSLVSYAWQQVSGPAPASFSSPSGAATAVSGLVAGTYVFSLTVSDDQQAISAADQVTITVNPDPTVAGAAHRINAGGTQVSNSRGTFKADEYFSNGWGESWNRTTHATTNAIAGTLDDAIYQTDRASEFDNGTFSYDFPVANGQYRVVLHFAELYWSAPGQRVFDVDIEQVKMLDNYDIVQKAGANFTATTESFVVNVTDKSLRVFFTAASLQGGVNRPVISAIEVLPISGANILPLANAGADQTITLPLSKVVLQGAGTDADGTISSYAWSQESGPNTATFSDYRAAAPTVSGLVAGTYVFSLKVSDDQQAQSAADQVTVTVNAEQAPTPVVLTSHRINAGGPQLTSPAGTFAADNFYTPAPGFTYSTANAITGSPEGALYQTERSSTADNGAFSYALPLSSGQYTVVLHFAELYWNAPGQRVFDVQAEGTLVLDNYDIVQKTGANFTATTETFVVDVTDGTLDLLFSALASEGGVNRPKVAAIEVSPYQGTAAMRVAMGSGNVAQVKAGTGLALSAYPNPFQREINLNLVGVAAGQYTVRVLDVLGKQLYQSGFTAEASAGQVYTIPMSDKALTRGSLYLVVVEQPGGSFRKVIKMMKE